MKFVYLGSEDSPDEVTTYGYCFRKNGDPVDVSGMAELKLSNNTHFKAVVDAVAKPIRGRPPKYRKFEGTAE